MSYIRSTSNPEKLYIFGNMAGDVEIYQGPKLIGYIPGDNFDKFIDLYIDNFCEDIEYNGIKIETVFPKDTGNGIKERLSYGDWFIDMYDVTWYYIARSNYGRSKGKFFHFIRKIFNIY